MTIVTCAIIENDGKILIARRALGQKLAGKWEFPGGKVEAGESAEECLKRELAEEFSIQVEVGEFICSNKHHYDHIFIELIAFRTKFISGDFKLTDHNEIQWVKPADLLDYDLSEADILIAREVMDHARYNPRS
ncbi:MAG: (deoxy)nucleoside triphosphate pyrophosphohydrolase [Deltaproteobacteria bacterium]|nr:(deoxy)nucleoside triphosphate pyrophosphohydrolase [Deltaproteobacteria bacterium]